jgi:hypothetical protein
MAHEPDALVLEKRLDYLNGVIGRAVVEYREAKVCVCLAQDGCEALRYVAPVVIVQNDNGKTFVERFAGLLSSLTLRQ